MGKGRDVLSWLGESGRNLKTRAGERLRSLRGHWGSKYCEHMTGLPRTALGKPISEIQEQMAIKDRHYNGSGVAEGSKTRMKTIGSGSASTRLASQKPVDRPVS